MTLNIRAGIGCVLVIAAIGVMIAGMSVQNWVVVTSNNNVLPNGDTMNIGLKSWSWYHSASSVSTSGQLSNGFSPNIRLIGVDPSKLDTGGTIVISCGVIGLVAALIGDVMVFLSLAGTRPKYKAGGIIGVLVALVLFVVGALLYAQQIWVYWSFLVYLVSGFIMLIAFFVIGKQLFGDPEVKMFAIATAISAVSIILAVVSMSQEAWLYNNQVDATCGATAIEGTWNVGLKAWTATFPCPAGTVTFSGDLSSLPPQLGPAYTSYMNNLAKGGNYVLGFGIVGMLFAVAGAVVNFLALYPNPKQKLYQSIGVALVLLAGILMIVGMALYAQQLGIDASFMLMILAAFMLFVACVLFVISSMTFAPDAAKPVHGKPDQPDRKPSKTIPGADPNNYDAPVDVSGNSQV